MAYVGYITNLKNLRKHPNADRLQLAEVFGNTVCVDLSFTEKDKIVYFPTDGQLSEEFCNYNNLVRKKDADGNNIGGYMDPDKRNVTAVRLRGEKSDGLVLKLDCFDYIKKGIGFTFDIGSTIDIIDGHEICHKYIPMRRNRNAAGGAGKQTKRRAARSIAPLFYEHADTEQLAYNLKAFKEGDQIEVTLKMHGTSQRTGYLPVLQGYKGRNIWEDRIIKTCTGKDNLGKFAQKLYDKAMNNALPIYDYDYVTGTRRVVLDSFDTPNGFYGENKFREQHAKKFEGKLWKGETVYYEVVGFTDTGAPIMAPAGNKKTNDKAFVKQYGETTVFSYGCDCAEQAWREDRGQDADKPTSDMYVYRMTMTNPDGEVVEYTPDFMRYRCEQMGIKTVPVFWNGFVPDEEVFTGVSCEYTNPGEWVQELAEDYYDGPDPVGKTHVREGVVVRIINRPRFAAYKHKNFNFKVLEGIAKVDADAPDMEEAQEMAEE